MKDYSDSMKQIIAQSDLRTQALCRGLSIYCDTAEYYEIPGNYRTVFSKAGWDFKVYSDGTTGKDEFELDLSKDKVVAKSIDFLASKDDWELCRLNYLDEYYFWQLWDRMPMKEEFLNQSDRWIFPLAKSPELQKIFWRHWNIFRKQDASHQLFDLLGMAVSLLGRHFDSYIQRLLSNQIAISSCNPDTLYHDLIYNLYDSDFYFKLEEVAEGAQLSAEHIDFLLSKARTADWQRAQRTVEKWDEVLALGWTPQQGLNRFFALCSQSVSEVIDVVKELRNKIAHLPSTIPAVFLQTEEWTVRTLNLSLDSEILLGLNIGEFTGCCQHIGGAAHSSALYSVTHQDSNVLIAEKNGEIYAQSWLWRKGSILVMDNLEVKASTKETRQTITALWLEVAKQMVGELGVETVFLGLGNGDHVLDTRSLDWTNVSRHAPKGCYTDADNAVLLAGRFRSGTGLWLD